MNDDDYYLIWLRTLEEFLGETKKIQSDEIIQYFQDWRAAYLNTPHGQSVKLENLSADQFIVYYLVPFFDEQSYISAGLMEGNC